jgi:hypothetical protein
MGEGSDSDSDCAGGCCCVPTNRDLPPGILPFSMDGISFSGCGRIRHWQSTTGLKLVQVIEQLFFTISAHPPPHWPFHRSTPASSNRTSFTNYTRAVLPLIAHQQIYCVVHHVCSTAFKA